MLPDPAALEILNLPENLVELNASANSPRPHRKGNAATHLQICEPLQVLLVVLGQRVEPVRLETHAVDRHALRSQVADHV